jgi:hypothetical protein
MSPFREVVTDSADDAVLHRDSGIRLHTFAVEDTRVYDAETFDDCDCAWGATSAGTIAASSPIPTRPIPSFMFTAPPPLFRKRVFAAISPTDGRIDRSSRRSRGYAVFARRVTN